MWITLLLCGAIFVSFLLITIPQPADGGLLIATQVIIGAGVGITSSTLAISRQLYNISILNGQSKTSKEVSTLPHMKLNRYSRSYPRNAMI